jgi:hypothetical protein
MIALVMMLAVPGVPTAQVLSIPAPPPAENAADRDWYLDRAPIYVNGDVYYPAGATVFFNGNAMVPSGTFDGVELYVDTTLEPHSIVFVPIGRGLLQPYERRRQGELAGTVGSRTPSFPIQRDAEALASGAAYTAPGYHPEQVPLDVAVDPRLAPRPTSSIGLIEEGRSEEEPTGSTGVVPPFLGPVQTAIPPQSNAGVWIEWNGTRWQLDGRAVRNVPGQFTEAGDYHGYTVYRARAGDDAVIYLPSREDLLAPYRKDGRTRPQE